MPWAPSVRLVQPQGRRAFNALSYPPPSAAPAASGSRLWLATDYGTLTTWLKGETNTGAGGSNIATWTDQSGSGNNGTGTSSSSARPTVVASGLNSMNTVAFTGGTGSIEYFTLPSGLLASATEATVFVLYKHSAYPPGGSDPGPPVSEFGTAAASDHLPYTTGDYYPGFCSTTRRGPITVPAPGGGNGWRIACERSKAGRFCLDIDGVNYLDDSTNTFAANSVPTIGGSPTYGAYMAGQIAEVILVPNFVADGDDLDRFFAATLWRWGLQSQLPVTSSYTAAAPTFGALATVTGTVAATEDNDTASATGASTITGTAAASEANDTSTASGSVNVTGTEAATEASDTAASSGSVTVSGSAASTEAADSASGTGTTTITGTSSATEAADTCAAAGAVSVTGAIASTEAADTASASGTASVAGSGEITEASDTASAVGVLTVTGSGVPVEANDNCSASGTIGTVGVSGSVAVTEADDSAAASGAVAIVGTAASAEWSDACSALGSPVVGASASASEAGDTASASGGVVILGTFAANENDDSSAATGNVAPIRTGLAPPSRTGKVEADDRTASVAGSSRIGAVEGSPRSASVGGTSRTGKVSRRVA